MMSDQQLSGTRDVLLRRRAELVEQRAEKRHQVKALLRQLMDADEELRATDRHLEIMDEFLRLEFGAHDVDAQMRLQEASSWNEMPLIEAVGKALEENDRYLTESQIREVLSAHGIRVDDSVLLAQKINEAIGEGAPLIKVSEKHYGRREWAEEAREGKPSKSGSVG